MKTSIDHAGRLLIPKEIRRKSGIKPGMPLEVRWEKGAIAITPAPLPVKLRRRDRLLVAIRRKNGPSLSTKTVNLTRKAQRKDFWRLVDRAHKEGERKGLPSSTIYLSKNRSPKRRRRRSPRLSFHLPGDVAQDAGSPSSVGGVRQVYRLEKISVGAITVRNADGVFKRSTIENKA